MLLQSVSQRVGAGGLRYCRERRVDRLLRVVGIFERLVKEVVKVLRHAHAPEDCCARHRSQSKSKTNQQASVIDARQLRSIIHGRMPKTRVPRMGCPTATEGG